MFWKGNTAIDGLSGSGSTRAWTETELRPCSSVTPKLNPPRSHGLGDVLKDQRPKVVTADLDLAPDLPIGVIGDAECPAALQCPPAGLRC